MLSIEPEELLRQENCVDNRRDISHRHPNGIGMSVSAWDSIGYQFFDERIVIPATMAEAEVVWPMSL